MPTCNLFETVHNIWLQNLAIGVLASLLQHPMTTCEHSGNPHCIMPFYKEVHLGLI
jgi:hypothetical protein